MAPDKQTEESVAAKRQIYCNRTLNMRSIGAIGYDMDYTLVHYRVETWERRAYDHIREHLSAEGWPVAELRFDPELVTRGLVIDTELGNLVKANRFGYVMRATHGTRPMAFEEQRAAYRHVPVDLSEPRYFFLNTLFALSGSCLFAQLVDLYDQQLFPHIHGYHDLFERILGHVDQTHVEGSLKAEIMADPDGYVELDPEAPLALLDQLNSGKRLMLISNAEWPYVRELMAHSYDRFLPDSMSWRDLFELVIVGARKPDFFSTSLPLFSIVDEDQGLLQPVPREFPGAGIFVGGDAGRVESYLGLSGSEILYVGDHIFADVRMSKSVLRWRTGLILRELEDEVESLEGFRQREQQLACLMADKQRLESEHCALRLELQRMHKHYGPEPTATEDELSKRMSQLWDRIMKLDELVAPLARDAGTVSHKRWGPLLRAGNDKSHLARQVERSADIYTSRISNFLYATPFAYLRASRGSMPHDPPSVAPADNPGGAPETPTNGDQ
jgi:HAD superfamily 5'-nucleotidase-like hydrolase